MPKEVLHINNLIPGMSYENDRAIPLNMASYVENVDTSYTDAITPLKADTLNTDTNTILAGQWIIHEGEEWLVFVNKDSQLCFGSLVEGVITQSTDPQPTYIGYGPYNLVVVNNGIRCCSSTGETLFAGFVNKEGYSEKVIEKISITNASYLFDFVEISIYEDTTTFGLAIVEGLGEIFYIDFSTGIVTRLDVYVENPVSIASEIVSGDVFSYVVSSSNYIYKISYPATITEVSQEDVESGKIQYDVTNIFPESDGTITTNEFLPVIGGTNISIVSGVVPMHVSITDKCIWVLYKSNNNLHRRPLWKIVKTDLDTSLSNDNPILFLENGWNTARNVCPPGSLEEYLVYYVTSTGIGHSMEGNLFLSTALDIDLIGTNTIDISYLDFGSFLSMKIICLNVVDYEKDIVSVTVGSVATDSEFRLCNYITTNFKISKKQNTGNDTVLGSYNFPTNWRTLSGSNIDYYISLSDWDTERTVGIPLSKIYNTTFVCSSKQTRTFGNGDESYYGDYAGVDAIWCRPINLDVPHELEDDSSFAINTYSEDGASISLKSMKYIETDVSDPWSLAVGVYTTSTHPAEIRIVTIAPGIAERTEILSLYASFATSSTADKNILSFDIVPGTGVNETTAMLMIKDNETNAVIIYKESVPTVLTGITEKDIEDDYDSSNSIDSLFTIAYTPASDTASSILAGTLRYKVSLLYDGYQETALSYIYDEYTMANNGYRLDIVLSLKKNNIDSNKRITHVCIYRTMKDGEVNVEYGYYRLLEQIPISYMVENGDKYEYRVSDLGSMSGASYDAINSISQEQTDYVKSYMFATAVGNSIIVGNYKTAESDNNENNIVLSMPNRPDVFNLTEDVIRLPFNITALSSYYGKALAFNKTRCAIVDVNGKYVETVVNGIGALNSDRVCQTPYGIYVLSNSGLFLFDGTSFKEIGLEVKSSTRYTSILSLISSPTTKIMFSPIFASLIVGSHEITGNYYSLLYNIKLDSWSVITSTTEMECIASNGAKDFYGTAVGASSCIYELANNTSIRTLKYITKYIDFDCGTKSMKWIYRIEGSNYLHYGVTNGSSTIATDVPVNAHTPITDGIYIMHSGAYPLQCIDITYRRGVNK